MPRASATDGHRCRVARLADGARRWKDRVEDTSRIGTDDRQDDQNADGAQRQNDILMGQRTPPFSRLQDLHRTCRFSGVVAPPITTGMMWSNWSSSPLPHFTHRPPSLRYTKR